MGYVHGVDSAGIRSIAIGHVRAAGHAVADHRQRLPAWREASEYSSGTGFQAVSSMVSPVVLTNTPRPAPPLDARALSLQAGAVIQTQAQAHAIPARLPLGMDVFWDPALASGVTFWPSPPPAPPPLEATSFQVERQLNAAGPWQPLIGGDNLVLGNRASVAPDTAIRSGIDLMQVYPESRGPESTSTQFTYRDTFLTAVPPEKQGTAMPQPPPPGSMVQYQVRAVDVVGRPSDMWTQTHSVRLEKHSLRRCLRRRTRFPRMN